MRLTTVITSLALAAPACGSDPADSPACPDVSGNYTVRSTRLSGSCDLAVDGDGENSITIQKSGADYSVLVSGASTGCPAKMDAATCKLTSSCQFGSGGVASATVSVEYTFAGGKFSGSQVSTLAPPSVPQRCDVNYRDEGTKL